MLEFGDNACVTTSACAMCNRPEIGGRVTFPDTEHHCQTPTPTPQRPDTSATNGTSADGAMLSRTS